VSGEHPFASAPNVRPDSTRLRGTVSSGESARDLTLFVRTINQNVIRVNGRGGRFRLNLANKNGGEGGSSLFSANRRKGQRDSGRIRDSKGIR